MPRLHGESHRSVALRDAPKSPQPPHQDRRSRSSPVLDDFVNECEALVTLRYDNHDGAQGRQRSVQGETNEVETTSFSECEFTMSTSSKGITATFELKQPEAGFRTDGD